MRLCFLYGGAYVTGQADSSADFGRPAYFEDFDNDEHRTAQPGVGGVWTIGPSTGPTRYRVELLLRNGTRNVEDIWIRQAGEGTDDFTQVLHLHGANAERLVGLMRDNAFDPADGSVVVESNPEVLRMRGPYQRPTSTTRTRFVHSSRAMSRLVMWSHSPTANRSSPSFGR